MLYYSMREFLAERFHCSGKLLAALNPELDLEALEEGQQLTVPNVVAFDVERYVSPEGKAIWSKLVGHGRSGRRVHISKRERFLTLWEGNRMLRAFPVTVNAKKTPEGTREIGEVVPGPVYFRNQSKLDLAAGPNSPVGVIWCQLGDGYGIHGANNPDSIGRSVSLGCVRMANWDVVRLAGMVRAGGVVGIGETHLTEEVASR